QTLRAEFSANYRGCLPRQCAAVFSGAVPRALRRIRQYRARRQACQATAAAQMLIARRSLLKSNATALDQTLRLADPVIVVLIGWLAQWLYLGTPDAPPAYWIAMLTVALLSFAVFPATGLYRPQRGGSLIEDLRALASGWL